MKSCKATTDWKTLIVKKSDELNKINSDRFVKNFLTSLLLSIYFLHVKICN